MIEGGIEFVHQKAVWVDKTAGFPTAHVQNPVFEKLKKLSYLS